MRTIDLQQSKLPLTTVVEDAERGEASMILRDGRPAAVVVAYAEWERLSTRRSFADLLLASPIEPGDIPERDRRPMRDVGF